MKKNVWEIRKYICQLSQFLPWLLLSIQQWVICSYESTIMDWDCKTIMSLVLMGRRRAQGSKMECQRDRRVKSGNQPKMFKHDQSSPFGVDFKNAKQFTTKPEFSVWGKPIGTVLITQNLPLVSTSYQPLNYTTPT